MAPPRGPTQRRTTTTSNPVSTKSSVKILTAALTAVGGTVLAPLFLIYLILRCEKNQAVLFQMPLVIPRHAGAYMSPLAGAIVLSFISLMFLVNFARPLKRLKLKTSEFSLSPSLVTLVMIGLLLAGLVHTKPDFVDILFNHYLHLLVATTVFSILFVGSLMMVTYLGYMPKHHFDRSGVLAFFWGLHSRVQVGPVELKSFFYVSVGMVAWGVLDLLILSHSVLHDTMTGPLGFLVFTQLAFIGHALCYEQYLMRKPYKETEGLGFFWMMKVLMYLPFFHSLPVFIASVTEISLPKPAMLSDIVLFVFGFIVYVSAVHQKENFVADPSAYRNLQSIPATPGKRLLVSGYWSVVQKPDYLGLMIIWLSWAIACGFSAMSLIVLFTMWTSLLVWQHQLNEINSKKLGTSWQRYTTAVHHKIIPMIF